MLSCHAKEETMDCTDFALDGNVNSFQHEFLYGYTRFWTSVSSLNNIV